MNRYKDILTTKKDHLEEEKNISVDERVDNLIKLKRGCQMDKILEDALKKE